MNEACQRYAEDPEANAAHLQECAECRAIYGMLNAPIESKPMNVNALPLAPWEGAAYRSWPLVIGGALVVLAVAFVLCAAAGISPLRAVAVGMSASPLRGYIISAADALRGASVIWQVAFGFGFILVNTLLVLLLRRAPRGVDA